ncbi:glutaredoxin-C4-like isoform X1 [Spodoptera litura]|uniref:Glutaredoxin-2, mitochondrial n=1 Tax=Spodoptera litura TaxID=69820 RepID=A0A9J7IS27_SPOLT|nr:glutaredoxin-C4-like isoform X1 [Spodoptera litura]
MGSLASKSSRMTVSKMANAQEIREFIKQAITEEKVVIFSKTYCPYCKLAKDVFNKVKQPFKVYELDEREDESDFQDNLAILNGFRSVPQVYINGKCIGGGTDVKILYETGKLEPMLIG